ncbi:MAG: hypothetical protein JNM56_06365 [Planctomycetia bacterium]|nr:hypothetical protein [Planctomycetia bacterium]
MLPKAEDFLGRRGALAARLVLLSLALLVLAGLWQAWPARPLATFPLESPCLGLRVSQDGSTLLAVQTDQLTLWDIANGTKRGECVLPTQPEHEWRGGITVHTQMEYLWLSADGRKVAFVSPWDEAVETRAVHVRLLNLETRPNAPFILPDCRGDLSCISPGSPVLATVSDRGHHLWDVATGKEIYPGDLFQDGIEDVCPLPDGRVLAVQKIRKAGWLWDQVGLYVWDLSGRSAPLWLPGATGPVRIISGGKRLTAARGFDLILVDLATGQTIDELRAGRPANSTRYQGDHLVALYPGRLQDGESDELGWTTYVWNVAAEPPVIYGPFAQRETPWPQVSPDGRWGAFWKRSNPTTVQWQSELVDLATRGTAGAIQEDVDHLTFSPDSQYLAALTQRPRPQPFLDRLRGRRAADELIQVVKVWTVPDCQPVAAFENQFYFAFVPGRPVLAVAGTEGDIELWELPPRRALWIDLLLVSLFGVVLLLFVRGCQQLRAAFTSPLPASRAWDPLRGPSSDAGS